MNRLLIFNPGHEEALRQPLGQSYTPRREVQAMMRELYPLMLLLADPGDYIAYPCDTPLRYALCDHLGRTVPAYTGPPLRIEPWAIEPHLLDDLMRYGSRLGLRLEAPPTTSTYLRLSHRDASADMLRYLARHIELPETIIPHWVYPAETHEATSALIATAIESLSAQTSALIVKRPFTSSGRGVMPLDLPISTAQLRSLVGSCHRARGISLEPRLDVQHNWALIYHVSPEAGVRLDCISCFRTEQAGSTAYSGNELRPQATLRHELAQLAGGAQALDRLIEAHGQWLTERIGTEYMGFVGIDLFSYHDEHGALRLHPCVEINMRCTMGVLAARAYERHVAPGGQGLFRLIYASSEELIQTIRELEHRYPPLRTPMGLASGYLPLTPCGPATTFHAYLLISSPGLTH